MRITFRSEMPELSETNGKSHVHLTSALVGIVVKGNSCVISSSGFQRVQSF